MFKYKILITKRDNFARKIQNSVLFKTTEHYCSFLREKFY